MATHRRFQRVLTFLWAAVIFTCHPANLQAETNVEHEVGAGLSYVYDSGYDRGLHYGLSYEFSWSALRAGAMFSLGDTDPRNEQRWSLFLGSELWSLFRFEVALHHRTYQTLGFGENILCFVSRFHHNGFEISVGYALRFPILDQDQINNPFVFDTTLFEHFLIARIGYIYEFRNGIGLGALIANFTRYELHNLDYPQFSLVISYQHPGVGRFVLDGGIGTAGFFNQGSTIDRGFIRLEYIRTIRQRPEQTEQNERNTEPEPDPELNDTSNDEQTHE